jgi:integrase
MRTSSIDPRGLNHESAASYIGIGTTLFDALVAEGMMPKPKLINNRKVWDRQELDIAFNELPNGEQPFAKIEARHVRVWLDDRADTPEAANGLLKALRALFRFAVDRGIAKRNPVAETSIIKTKTDGHHTWTILEVHKFEEHHALGSVARLAMALLLYTGSRRGDVVLLGRQHIRDGWIEFRHGKTRAEVDLPILPQLQAVLDATHLGQMTFLVSSFGKPFTANGFGNVMRQWCDQAGLPR